MQLQCSQDSLSFCYVFLLYCHEPIDDSTCSLQVSSAHSVCARGMYIAIVSTTVETSNPIAELNPGIALLKDIVERFDSVNDLLAPVNDGTGDKCYISKSYDATR